MIKHKFRVLVFYRYPSGRLFWCNDSYNIPSFSSKESAYLYALMFSYIKGCNILIYDYVHIIS